MDPIYTFRDDERDRLAAALATVPENPYKDYPAFSRSVGELDGHDAVPAGFAEACRIIRDERRSGAAEAHALRNCPMDAEIPVLDLDDPVGSKYAAKHTFVGEAFLELFSRLTGTPLLAYATRFNGDFFTDVVAHNKYRGKQTGFTDGDLVFHNDRTAHPVRADHITLLGLRCPEPDLVYTGFVSGRTLSARLSDAERRDLREPWYVTPFDVVSKDGNTALSASAPHAIIENDHSFRYLDTHTTTAPDAPAQAKDAVIALKNALARAPRMRHRIRAGDLFTFANQDGLHNREQIEVADPELARERWLLKTYAFADDRTADRYAHAWVDGVRGRVGD
ncbi:TauD/TfdA family dioxygenase [Amycolatopsis sp. lyj-109]|uniref:TauD/TfdA family dioxygenase n=1 Tax=Amycolatopsis sp. lyj-109 TaxID=2789287 RepID=UPI00397B4EBB